MLAVLVLVQSLSHCRDPSPAYDERMDFMYKKMMVSETNYMYVGSVAFNYITLQQFVYKWWHNHFLLPRELF